MTQKNTRVENPGKDDLYTVGVVAKVKQILKAQSEVMRVVVEGQYRARMCELVKDAPFYEVMCEELPMLPVEQGKQVTIDAYMRVVKDLFEKYCYYAPKMPKELVVNIIGSEDPVYISEYLAQNLGFSIEDKQMILEESSIRKRMEILSSLLRRENEILSIERSIAERVKEQAETVTRRNTICGNSSKPSMPSWARTRTATRKSSSTVRSSRRWLPTKKPKRN